MVSMTTDDPRSTVHHWSAWPVFVWVHFPSPKIFLLSPSLATLDTAQVLGQELAAVYVVLCMDDLFKAMFTLSKIKYL